MEDAGKATIKFTEEDHPLIIEEVKNALNHFKEIRSALIVDSPKNTVPCFLFENDSSELDNFEFKTFSTIEYTEKCLKKGKHYKL